MTTVRAASLFLPLLALCGQGVAIAQQGNLPSAGPSMADTIKFIDDTYQQQSPLVSRVGDTTYSTSNIHAIADGTCALLVSYSAEDGSTYRCRVALDQSNALSVDVVPAARADPGFTGFRVRFDGTFVLQPLSPSGATQPLTPQTMTEPFLVGVLSDVKPDELVFVTDKGLSYRVHIMDVRSVAMFHGASTETWTVDSVNNFNHFKVGERFSVRKEVGTSGKGKKRVETPYFIAEAVPSPIGYQKFSLPPVAAEDTANRLAKALIHAIVLCHRDTPAPLF